MKAQVYFLAGLALIIASCNKSSYPATTPTGTTAVVDSTGGKSLFISATSSGSFTAAQLQTVASLAGYSSYTSLIKYDVDFYKIAYYTNYNGLQTQVTGLLCIPKNTPVTPALLSAQHGTIFANTDAPSNFPNTFTGFELFAASGFVTIIPDYIGYGASNSITPPYYDINYSGSVVVDGLKAAKYYLTTLNKTISNKVFLVGYSEGGYATMAAQKAIETGTGNNLTLTATAEGAGGYDLTAFLSAIGTTPTYGDPSLLALLLNSYNVTYKWNRPLSDFFASPYAAKIPGLLNGVNTQLQVSAGLTTSTTALFNPTFYANIQSTTGELVLKTQFATNSFPNWNPKTLTRMYHGTLDEDVPYQTSVNTYNRFITAGSAQLTFISIPNGTHETSIQPMMLSVIPWMKALVSSSL